MEEKDKMKTGDFQYARATSEQLMVIDRMTAEFVKLATIIQEDVPVSAHRTAALRKMLEAKMTLVHGITHGNA